MCAALRLRSSFRRLYAIAVLAFCSSSWAVFPPPSVQAYSLSPSGAASGNVESATPQALCNDVVAVNFVGDALRNGWASAWVVSTVVYPAPDSPTDQFCEVHIGHCLSDGFCTGSYTKARIFQLLRNRCPINSTPVSGGCSCDTGYQEDAAQTACVAAAPEPFFIDASSQACRRSPDLSAGVAIGAPIMPAGSEKYRLEVDYADSGPAALTFARTYRSNWGANATRATGPLGKAWASNHSASLAATPAVTPTEVAITSPEGYVRTFARPASSSTWMPTNSADTLLQEAGGGWSHRRADDGSTYTFDPAGKLQAQEQRNGWATTYGYNAAGQLATVSNAFGRTLTLAYGGNGQLVTLSTPDSRVIGYAYDAAGRLSSVTYPDGKTRSFVYESTALPQALTGILDESGVRWGTFNYDSQGRAISTELSGGVSRYQVSYPATGTATVVDPLGTSRINRTFTVMTITVARFVIHRPATTHTSQSSHRRHHE